MRIGLEARGSDAALAYFSARLPATEGPLQVAYATRTGAILRVDGKTVAAFDREHREAVLAPAPVDRDATLEVERHALPTNGLPSGPGLRWTLYTWLSHPAPEMHLTVEPLERDELSAAQPVTSAPIALWGHAHLDVAWLWTYEDAHRKAQRTFANAIALLERDSQFVFAQSQPQLFAFVQAADPELFERVRALARAGRFDPDLAALWVEADCNLPSGEALLRQMVVARRYCREHFAIDPSIAWLPDSFGFANTLPTLLAHAGIRFFGTTKLQWNDTTRFPYPQFRWRGPDGSEVVSALIDGMEGGPTPHRVAIARDRREPIVAGFGDGGGGPTAGMVAGARDVGTWERPGRWFAALDARRESLPVHDDELYLEYHRGVYTTMHAIKHANAALERRLTVVEEALAWCVAMRLTTRQIPAMVNALCDVWVVLLRNQFHDVLPGTSIAPVHADALAEYVAANDALDGIENVATAALPRGAARTPTRRCTPVESAGEATFDNGILFARVRRDGTITELRAGRLANVCEAANVLTTYADRPKQWDAWNIDAGYERPARPVKTQRGVMDGDALTIPFRAGTSTGTMHIWAPQDAPMLCVDLDIDWRERHTLLRVENTLHVAAENAIFGSPHGTVARSTAADTPGRRAQYEVPGQRYAFVRNAVGAGMALFALDTYGWNAKTQDSGVRLGHSLLRSPTWPDPSPDRGVHRLRYAFVPFGADTTISDLERWWEMFACSRRVRLFASTGNALVVACYPTEDGKAVVLRVRECDGLSVRVHLRCGLRMRAVASIDACERPLTREVSIDGERLHFDLAPYELRSFRVTF